MFLLFWLQEHCLYLTGYKHLHRHGISIPTSTKYLKKVKNKKLKFTKDSGGERFRENSLVVEGHCVSSMFSDNNKTIRTN